MPNPEWFSDDVTLGGKGRATLEETAARWIIECAELVGLVSKELEGIKAYLSRQVDSGRAAWGRRHSRVRRQFIIVGTTNQGEYLRDPTGARRFLPVLSKGGPGEIDVEGLREARDQLWAQAVHAHEAGEKPALWRELWEAARAVQEERRVIDPYAERLIELLTDIDAGFIPTEELWRAIGKGKASREHRMKLIIADAMKRRGWELLLNAIRFRQPIEIGDHHFCRSSRRVERRCRGWAKGDWSNLVLLFDGHTFIPHDIEGGRHRGAEGDGDPEFP